MATGATELRRLRLEAFLVLIVIPLALAWLTQAWAARHRSGTAFAAAAGTLMVATLLIVVASQLPKLDGGAGAVLGVVPFYVAFLAAPPVPPGR